MTTQLGADVAATEGGRPRPPPISAEAGDAADTGGRQRSAPRARRSLGSPSALRQGIVLRELLGPPVALRPPTSDVPGLRP